MPVRCHAPRVRMSALGVLAGVLGRASAAMTHGLEPHDHLPVPLASIGDAVQSGLVAPSGAQPVFVRVLSLAVFALFFLQIYPMLRTWLARLRGRRFGRMRLALSLAAILVPIAIAYHMAHDLSRARNPVLVSERRERSLARAQELLAAVHPLHQAVDATAEAEVKTTVLCYCLAKAPEAVRELRRLAAERFAQGIAAWQAHAHRDAITAFTKTLQLHPRNTWAYLNRGLAYARLGQYAQAQADFTSALAADPQLTAAYYARGLVSILLEQVDQADHDIQRAAALGEPEARRVLETLVHGASEPATSGSALVKERF